MKLNLPTHIFPFSRRASSLLVCETDGFTLRAAVLSKTGDALAVDYVARSSVQDFKKAVAEVVGNLRVQGWHGNGKAVLLMPGVISALVELPVSPAKPRAAMQMHELVRSELEPLLLQHTTIWSVGRILVGLGYLEETQAREILARQQGRFQGKDGETKLEMYSLKRFGDVAIEQGYITRQQLDEALAKQAWLRMEGDDIACGWQALAGHEGESLYNWLASGVNKGLLKQWEAAFAAQRMTLEYLFPVAGCAAANVAQNTPAIVLETGGGQVVGMRLGDVGIEAIVTHESALNGAMEACLETYHGLTPPDTELILLAIGEAGTASLAATMTSIVGREVKVLTPVVKGKTEAVSAGMVGAARQVFGLSGAQHCCAVSTQGPKIPLTSLPQFRVAAGAGLIVLAILVAEAVLQVRQSFATAAADRVNQQAAVLDAAVAEVQVLIKQKEDVKAKLAEADKVEQRAAFYEEELPRRSALLRSLFNVLAKTVNDAIVIDRLAEEPAKGVVVSAWALSDAAAQQFVLSLKRELEVLDMALVDVKVAEKNGRLSLPGYGVTFRMVDKALASDATVAGTGKK